MEIAQLIIRDMNKEDIRHFKLYSTRMEYEYDRKDLQLFNLIKNNPLQYEDAMAMKALYKNGNRNAFYRIKHRLLNHLNKSLLLQYLDSNETILILTSMSLYHFHFSRNNFSAALYFLKKAERKANELESLELLDIIYSEFIKLFNISVDFNPETYILKQKQNAIKLEKLRQINQVLAMVSYRLKLTQNYADKNGSLNSLLQKTIRDFSKDKEIRNSKVLRLRLINVVSQSLLQKHDYKTLEEFLVKVYSELKTGKFFTKANHDNKLQILTFIVNSKFKNKKYKESLRFAGLLKTAMDEFDKLYFDKYLVFYTNALVMNYSITNPEIAIELLEEAVRVERNKKVSYYEMFVYLNLAILFFEKKDFDSSIKHMIKLDRMESFRKSDAVLRLKISVSELIIRFELAEWDMLEYRINQVMRNFKDLLKQENIHREKEMISIIKAMMKRGNTGMDKKLKLRIEKFAKLITRSNEQENDVIKYGSWLQEKLKAS